MYFLLVIASFISIQLWFYVDPSLGRKITVTTIILGFIGAIIPVINIALLIGGICEFVENIQVFNIWKFIENLLDKYDKIVLFENKRN
jgi:hypothetical protein